jgi:hypothetical protein
MAAINTVHYSCRPLYIIMNLANPNATQPEFDDVGPDWEDLLRQIQASYVPAQLTLF